MIGMMNNVWGWCIIICEGGCIDARPVRHYAMDRLLLTSNVASFDIIIWGVVFSVVTT